MLKAVATFLPNRHSNIAGVFTFEQPKNGGSTYIYGIVNGLNYGKHGIHIHEYGDLSSGCDSAGAHYNPYGKTHGGPDMTNRHVGDLGNITCINPNASTFFEIRDSQISLVGPHSIIGRTLIIHEDEDDLGRGNSPLSKSTGNSGRRIACAVIGIGAPTL